VELNGVLGAGCPDTDGVLWVGKYCCEAAGVIAVFQHVASAATNVRMPRTLIAACDVPKTETFPAHYG
jgi:hypothetical protein